MAHGRNLSPGMVRIIRPDADSYLGLQIYHDVSQKLLPLPRLAGRPFGAGERRDDEQQRERKGRRA